MMTLLDFIIIYLACGAPFGVYIYIQNRRRQRSNILWTKTILVFVFWLPLALLNIRKIKKIQSFTISDFNNFFSEENKIEKNVHSIQKTIERIFLESNSRIQLFNFRQIFEQYVGLTLALKNVALKTSDREKDIFRIAGENNVELAAVCLERRNRKRLLFHQINARQDFIRIIEIISDSISDTGELEKSTNELISLLNDIPAQKITGNLFATNLQTANLPNVKQTEKVLWKTEIPKPSLTKPISTRIQTLTTATTNLHSED